MQTIYEKIYEIVSQIPKGKVSTYGRIATMLPRCTARMVGYAMAALPENSGVPWQRVINAQGRISPRASGNHDRLQEELLKSEGVSFDSKGKIKLEDFLWP